MKLNVIAVGKRQPKWVNQGFSTYAKRLAADCNPALIEVPTAKRSKTKPLSQSLHEEAEHLLRAIPPNSYVIALDESGQQWDTKKLSWQLATWREEYATICFLIGGPDGLTPTCRQRAHCVWSLSKLTLPHGLVRILVVEQLYRGFSLLKHHPYHRA